MKRIKITNSYSVLSLSIIALTVSACGTIPVPGAADSESAKVVIDESLLLPEQRAEIPAQPAPTINQPDVQVNASKPQQEYMGSAKAYWRQAVRRLQNGDEAGARWSLDQALEMKPGYARASKLLSQLDADPIALLGKQSFEYRLQYGDTLSKLAATHLDDPLSFYLLARYNRIENPGRVQVGQLIRIPGETIQTEPVQDLAVSDTSYLKARQFFEIGKYNDAITLLEGSLDEMGMTDDELRAIHKLMTNSFIQQANSLEKQQKLLSAKELLSKAAELQPGNTDILFHLESLNARLELDQYYQQGLRAVEDGRSEEAFIAFDKVLEIDPGHREAKEKRDALFLTVADRLYKRALLAQRRQNLNQAIELWDQFILMMPDNENARLYRAKAVRMQASLQKIAAQ